MGYTKEDIDCATRLLNDPERFGESIASEVLSLGLLGPLFQDQPRHAWQNRDKAFRLARRALTVPGADVPKLVGRAQDLSNDLVTSIIWREHALALAFERLRLDLVRISTAFDTPYPADVEAAAELNAVEAELDRLSEGESAQPAAHP